MGTKWIAQGASRTGVDCVGLIVGVAYELELYPQNSIVLPRWSQIPHNNVLIESFSKYLRRIAHPCQGCVALFNQKQYGIRQLFHAGIIGEKYFYEASMPNKCVTRVSISDTALSEARAFFVFQKPDEDLAELEYI